VTSLDWPALQFQTPDRVCGITLDSGTYTLRQNRGQSRVWCVDLLTGTVGDYTTRSLGSHRIEGPGVSDVTTLGVSGSSWERVFTVNPAGGTPTFVGTLQHGYEHDTALTVTVDGATVTPTSTPTTGTEVTVTRTSVLHHPDLSNIANATTIYTMSPNGLDVEWSVAWSADLAGAQCYGAMMPCASLLDTGKTLTGTKATLTADDDSVKSSSQSATTWLWDADGYHGACMTILDLATVANWAYTDSKNAWIQDRSGGSINKAYAGFTGRDPVNGATWTGRVRYMADYFDGLAATTLDK
jgi:hypothetical protein